MGVWLFVCVWGGGCTVEAACEMPRPYMENLKQASEVFLLAKNVITHDVNDAKLVLPSLEQLLHKIKANRRREILLIRCGWHTHRHWE